MAEVVDSCMSDEVKLKKMDGECETLRRNCGGNQRHRWFGFGSGSKFGIFASGDFSACGVGARSSQPKKCHSEPARLALV